MTGSGAAITFHPGQRRKSKTIDEFDAFIQAISGGGTEEGRQRQMKPRSVGAACTIRKGSNGTSCVHDWSCPGMGLAGGGACPQESECSKPYAAGSFDGGLVSTLRMAMLE